MIAGYMGASEIFDDAIAEFAVEYADQAYKDHRSFVKAVRQGRIKQLLRRDSAGLWLTGWLSAIAAAIPVRIKFGIITFHQRFPLSEPAEENLLWPGLHPQNRHEATCASSFRSR